MLLVTKDEAWHISRPLVDFGLRQPVGVGDVTSGLLLVKLLQGDAARCAGARYRRGVRNHACDEKYAGI
jgi:pyridoxine kinase